MSKKTLILSLTILANFSITQFATAYVPYRNIESHKQAVSGSLEVLKSEYRVANSTALLKNSGNLVGVGYSYGSSEDMTLGGKIAYSSKMTIVEYQGPDINTDSKGFNDIEFMLRARKILKGTLLYGTALHLSLGDHTLDASEPTSTKANSMSGGSSLTPYAGFEYSLGVPKIGAILTAEMNLSDKVTKNLDSGTTTKTSGGATNVFISFLEFEFRQQGKIEPTNEKPREPAVSGPDPRQFSLNTLGFEYKSKGTASKEAITSGVIAKSAAVNYEDFLIYALIQYGPFEMEPRFGYSRIVASGFDKNSQYLVNFNLQYNF